MADRTSAPPSADVVIIGAGPAGLTAAHELARRGLTATLFEADRVVGGISRTVERDGWRFDIGGHRFFTKAAPVDAFWDELLGPDDFPPRPRLSRIYYRGRFFDYPLRAVNALRGLGVIEAVRCLLSYLWVRLRPPRDQSSFETWVAARFGWRLYRIFFKTYTEKVWGVPASDIRADWAAQRIKNLSLGKAVVRALLPSRGRTDITSLIDEFRYPRLGPGMMWERCREVVEAKGSKVLTDTPVVAIEHRDGLARAVVVEHGGARTTYPADHVISSMPLGALVAAMAPSPPAPVVAAAHALRHRDFLIVALVVPEHDAFPDNWIYVHAPDVRVGRIQNFGAWSTAMVKPGRTCLGLEYFVNAGDDLWTSSDEVLVARATAELEHIGLMASDRVETGFVVRMPLAYPVYDGAYLDNVAILRAWLDEHTPNVHPVGRNGMHKYNNQDHSMLTAMRTVENIADGAHHDVWAVNVEQEYHEEGDTIEGANPEVGTGRAAPVVR